MSPHLIQIRDRFVNLYLIEEPDGLSLIDAGTARAPALVARTLARRGYGLRDLRHILITHADMDHIGGAAALAAASGAALCAGAVEAAALSQGMASRPPRGHPALQPLFGLMDAAFPIAPARASRILQPGEVLPILGGLRVLATPGHTPGHCAFYAPAHGLLFAGDALLALGGRLRFLDGPFTWDYAQGCASVRALAALDVRMIGCGHGPVLRDAQIRFP